ncbi:MAG: single-stranded DNA-binding protein, partial [Actinomycetota bacterium]
SYFNVTAWGDLGENAAASLSKGTRIVVTGRLEQREYTTREGDKRTAIDVIADELGPSLRWATAQVERTPRKEGGAKKSGGSTSPAGEASPFEGEEPF